MSLWDRLRSLGSPFPRRSGPIDRVAALARRPYDRAVLRRHGRLAELRKLRGDETSAARPGAERVLVLSLRGWPNHCAYEAVIARALQMRGAEVALVTCGGGQPACEMGWGRRAYPRPCDRCAWYTDQAIDSLGLPSYRLVDGFDWGRDGRRAPRAPELLGDAPVDLDWATAVSVPWFLKTTHTEHAADGEQAARDYRVSVAAVGISGARILDDFQPSAILMVNGEFASERAFRELASARDIRVVTYEMGQRKHTVFFAQNSPAPDYRIDALWAEAKDRELTPEQMAAVRELLALRERGEGTHLRYFETTERDSEALRHTLGLEPGRRLLSLFTNISWDSAAVGHDIGFPTMIDWITAAVETAGRTPEVTLVVRVHPGEAKWGTNEDIEAALLARLSECPPNVRVVPSAQPLDSYVLMDLSETVFTYTSTVGLEAATRGVPVVVAGATHYRGRGFTRDIEGRADLERAIAEEGRSMTPEQLELAHRYAYAFFFRALIPFAGLGVTGSQVGRIPAREELEPGRDPYLDLVCERILDGREIFLPDELAAA